LNTELYRLPIIISLAKPKVYPMILTIDKVKSYLILLDEHLYFLENAFYFDSQFFCYWKILFLGLAHFIIHTVIELKIETHFHTYPFAVLSMVKLKQSNCLYYFYYSTCADYFVYKVLEYLIEYFLLLDCLILCFLKFYLCFYC